ncbi:MAG TPA: IS110 family transposase [Actinophytocola sp.]|uniref:IS110 family transposase n=1 Tax=Actinophytocola sp. TaxID=1872138 RepID=UPI002E0AF24C|nr:IS110 family transposase [Actinophytocola sp.]
MTSIPDSARPAHPDISGEVILGVDTHADEHVAALLSAAGAPVATASFATTAAGYRALLTWARGHGPVGRAGVEGTGSYGAALTRYLRHEGIAVVEVNRPDRAARRRRGKTDPVDAEAAARAVLDGRATVTPKTADGPVEMLRMFRLARASAVKSRTQAVNQLKAVLVGADPALREAVSGLTGAALVRACASLPAAQPRNVATATAYTLRCLAQRIGQLTTQARNLQRQITAVINTHAPQLLRRRGVGPDSAAALLIAAGDNPDRLHSDASFAALCGVSPIQASSGKTTRHRLNRGGDRGPTPRSTASPSPGYAATPLPAATSTGAPPRARPAARPSAASSATSPARFTAYSNPSRHRPGQHLERVDKHRGIRPRRGSSGSASVDGDPPGVNTAAIDPRRFTQTFGTDAVVWTLGLAVIVSEGRVLAHSVAAHGLIPSAAGS